MQKSGPCLNLSKLATHITNLTYDLCAKKRRNLDFSLQAKIWVAPHLHGFPTSISTVQKVLCRNARVGVFNMENHNVSYKSLPTGIFTSKIQIRKYFTEIHNLVFSLVRVENRSCVIRSKPQYNFIPNFSHVILCLLQRYTTWIFGCALNPCGTLSKNTSRIFSDEIRVVSLL